MTKQDIIDYVVTTPHNPNKAVLSTMLDSFGVSDNKEEIELSATENKVYTPEEGKVYKKVTVNVPAPPSEITTAQVTVENEGGGLDDPYISLLVMDNDVITAKAVTEGTYTVALYHGSLKAVIEGTPSAVATGDCQVDGYNATITGDCTITL